MSAEPRCPFPYLGGVALEVLASLHEAHGLLWSALSNAVSDVLCRRARPEDSLLPVLVENAYAEVVQSRAHLRAHIRCGREPDGTFRWEFPLDPRQSATVTFTGIRLENAQTKETSSFQFDQPILPAIGKALGGLDGTRRLAEVRASVGTDPQWEPELTRLLEALDEQGCLTTSARSSVNSHWLNETRDQDVVHLGHAGLLYRRRDQFFLFDPWLVPWYLEAPIPSLCPSVLPRPAAIFLTHEHSDHMDARTLLVMPKDIPVIVPSRRNRRALYYDYPAILHELGFEQIIELAHGECWPFDGGVVEAVRFYGEDPCDLELPRNCYLIVDRGRNLLVHADSGPTNEGRSAVKDGVVANLVRRYGPIQTVFASQQRTREVRGQSGYGYLCHPGRWLETGESTCVSSLDCEQLAANAKARLFVSYATGGADWFPEHIPFLFSRLRPARNALLTVHWEPLEALQAVLARSGCNYHYSQALDLFRVAPDGGTAVASVAEELDPIKLFETNRAAHGSDGKVPL